MFMPSFGCFGLLCFPLHMIDHTLIMALPSLALGTPVSDWCGHDRYPGSAGAKCLLTIFHCLRAIL